MYPRKLVPDRFEVPTRIEVEGVILAPIGLASWVKDVHAVRHVREYMIQNPGLEILNPGLELPGDMLFGLSDACYLDKLWRLRASFTYGIMTPDEREELGCLYVYGTRKLGYEAEVVSWVRSDDLRELGEKIYQFAESWVPEQWPFEAITWPGRKTPWVDWFELPDKDPQNWSGNPPSYALVPRRLVADSFAVPDTLDSDRFKLLPLHLNMDSVAKHYEACVSSIDHLEGVFGPENDWYEDKSFQEAIADVGYFHFFWHTRGAFVYSVRNPEDTREIGCLYVMPTEKEGYQAEVYVWAREDALGSGLEEELDEFSHHWIEMAWPFESVAWPGREIGWAEWKSLPDW